MASASKIAKYIVKEALKRKMPVTNLKLQKTVIFCSRSLSINAR